MMLDKGTELERQAHKFVWQLGFVPRSNTRFWFEGVEEETAFSRYEEATDIDVLGIAFDGFLRQERFMVDCKHAAEGVLSQILRCKGLQQVLAIDHALLLREKVGAQHRRFADTHGLQVMKVEDFLAMVGGGSDYGSFTPQAFEKNAEFLKGLSRDFNRDVVVPLGNSILTRDPFERIKDLVRVLDSGLHLTPKSDIESDRVSPRTWVMYRTFNELALTVVECGSRLMGSPASQMKADLQVRLAGDVEFKRAVVAKVKSLDRAEGVPPTANLSIADLAPTYTDALYEAIKYSVQRSGRMQLHLRFLDLLLFGYLLLDKRAQVSTAAFEIGASKEDVAGFFEWLGKVADIVAGLPGAPDFLAAFR